MSDAMASGEAKGTAATLRLKKVRPKTATESESMMSIGTG